MEVLLRQEVEKLGKAGDLVKVAAGYARNYLLPRRLAVTVSKENLRLIDSERKKVVQEEEARLGGLREVAEKLGEASVTIAEKASPEGHLYGSVGPQQIASALHGLGFEIDAKMIMLDDPIKELNVYDVTVRLHADIEATCKVWVVSDSE